jgi:hypothetical protein
MKKRLIAFCIVLLQCTLHAQNVNQFTGAFSYNIPLLHVPSNKGAGVPIDVSYGGGIQMNQPASEIGLGWNINAGGEIYRNVSTFPDDASDFVSRNLITGERTHGAGILFPSPTGATHYDLTNTSRGLDSSEFTFPAYDSYNVSAPGFGGQMKPACFAFNQYDNKLYASPDKYGFMPNSSSTRKVQFHFIGDFADTIVSRHYPIPGTISTFNTPGTSVTGHGHASASPEPYIGEHVNGTSASGNQNFDTVARRLAGSNFIEYFTNADINAAAGNLFASGDLKNFIDYKSAHSRSSSNFPSDGIGYFRITASNGLTYHYSLPVYELESAVYSTPLNYDYTIPTVLAVTRNPYDYPTNGYYAPNDTVIGGAGNVAAVKLTTWNKYAYKWLLTAITGVDYKDVNHNHMVDDQDVGYWVSYDYQMWNKVFSQRGPVFGSDYQYSPHTETQDCPTYFPFEPTFYNNYKLSGLYSSASLSKRQVYYLSKIRTSSHTAVFIRDIRKDESSVDPNDVTQSSSHRQPGLLLKGIVLFTNEDHDAIVTSPPSYNPSGLSYWNLFYYDDINDSSTFYTSNWLGYVSDYRILKRIEFDQDYSLCRKYHNNIEVNCVGATPFTTAKQVQGGLSVSTYTSSGKLTLKRILTYELDNVKLTPSIKFDYQNNLYYGNPDYNPIKTDNWGYFKYDATENGYSRYTNSFSKEYTRAWSMNSVTDPLGGITEIEYESNSYKKVIDMESSGGVRGPSFIYRLREDIDSINYNIFNVRLEEGYNSSSTITEFQSLASSNLSGLQKIICVPYARPEDPAGNCLSIDEDGFIFGNANLQVINGTNTSDHVRVWFSPGNNHSATNVDPPMPNYCSFGGSYTDYVKIPSNDPLAITYAGNGFIMFNTPIGYEAYGGGIRVKQIRRRNSPTELYVEDYTYSNGVAANEAGMYDHQVLKKMSAGSGALAHYTYLKPKEYSFFDMGPSIGYEKVTVKNLGRINTSCGKVETVFITDPSYNSNQFRDNFSIHTSAGHTGFVFETINECMNKFSSVFGATSETRSYDKNDNMVAKTVYEYESPTQGSLVENFYFVDTHAYGNSAASNTVNIMRDYPVVLKSTTEYGMGTTKKTETLRRDELTGEGTTIRSSGINQSSSISYKVPAYKFYQNIENTDYSIASSRKIMPYGADMYTYSNIDSAFTTSSGVSSSFLTAGYKLYSRFVRQRKYNTSTHLFYTDTVTLDNYINNRYFTFNAGAGSMNIYGLFSKTDLHSNPLNLSAINGTRSSPIHFWKDTSIYNWKLMNEVTLLDSGLHVVETRDMNNRFSASRWGYKSYYQTASASNCNYASFTFADFENAPYHSGSASLDGDIYVSNYNLVTSPAPHTGNKCIGVTSSSTVKFESATRKSPGNQLDIGLLPGRIYRAGVWVKNSTTMNAQMVVTVNGSVNSTAVSNVYTALWNTHLVATIGDWSLMQIDVEVPEGFSTGTSGVFRIELKSTSGTVYYDDFYLHPVESDFTGSVYDPGTGWLISKLDANGLATRFVYDASGKVIEEWKETPHAAVNTPGTGTFVKVRSKKYNYARGAGN